MKDNLRWHFSFLRHIKVPFKKSALAAAQVAAALQAPLQLLQILNLWWLRALTGVQQSQYWVMQVILALTESKSSRAVFIKR